MNGYLPDIIENYENAAERRLDEMTEGLPEGKFRCDCGNIDDLDHAAPSSSNPYCAPMCRRCAKAAGWPNREICQILLGKKHLSIFVHSNFKWYLRHPLQEYEMRIGWVTIWLW